jgi:hypothetical protein
MTIEEAKALVLREGLAGENAPDDAAFVLLHFGDVPDQERMAHLLKALRIICDGLQGETILNRPLAAALWTLGNSSNECLLDCERYARKYPDGAMDDVLKLIMAVEGVFYGAPFEGLKIAVKEG